MTSQEYQKERVKLWNESVICRNCGKDTVLPSDRHTGILNHNHATIQHEFDKLDPRRSNSRLFLWCFKCNQDDNKRMNAKLREEILIGEFYATFKDGKFKITIK